MGNHRQRHVRIGDPSRLVFLIEGGIRRASRSDFAEARRVERRVEATDGMVEGERNGSMRLRLFQFGSLEAVEQNSVLGTQRRWRRVDVRYDGTSTVESSGKPRHSTIAPIHQV